MVFIHQDVMWNLSVHTLLYLTHFNESRATFGCYTAMVILKIMLLTKLLFCCERIKVCGTT